MLTKRAYKREYTDGNRVAGFRTALEDRQNMQFWKYEIDCLKM